jgi:hypothetical protein
MREVLPGVLHVAKVQNIELLLIAAASSIDGEQNGPGDGTSDQAGDYGHFEQAEKEEGIKALVLQDESIGNGEQLR